MATPPRTIETLPPQRAGELRKLEEALDRAADFLIIAGVYSERGDPKVAGEKLEVARKEIADVLEELNTFRAPAIRTFPAERKPRDVVHEVPPEGQL
ncbi:MAG: hypothetical protein ACJ768_19560 [Gaiellaceae bacterium]